ncbi:MAG: DNA-3-methyladenine glycosylase 2 family protein, partial [Acidobacteriota bacterium]
MSNKAAFAEELRIAEMHLRKRDPILRPHIKRHSPCRLEPSRRYFETLVEAIISQQLSTSAARTILGRFRQLFAGPRFPTAAQILETTQEQLRGVGLSGQKASYVRDLATKTADGSLQLNRFSRL